MKTEEFERAVSELERQVIVGTRGDLERTLDVAPSGKFWLGRLASQQDVATADRNDRADRLEPCAIGMRIKLRDRGPWSFGARVRGCVWTLLEPGAWQKSPTFFASIPIELTTTRGTFEFGRSEVAHALKAVGASNECDGIIEVQIETRREGHDELVISFVNQSAKSNAKLDTRFYETAIEIIGLPCETYELEALPDSFRYDRSIPAYGINCSVERLEDGTLRTSDIPSISIQRPVFTPPFVDEVDLEFRTLTTDAIGTARRLADAHEAWGNEHWSPAVLERRRIDEQWSDAMTATATDARIAFWAEQARLREGLVLLENDSQLRGAFHLMNEAMEVASRGRYVGWRAFQLGFLISNLTSLRESSADTAVCDIVWFATGGGKTETYLGLLVTAMLLDRLRGKEHGITAWSRFPLRMLSLQQTQRFADALAAAELVRRRHAIGGAKFTLGFFVGDGATPNKISTDPEPGQPNPHDEDMPRTYRVLERCPFCQQDRIEMAFDQSMWTLEHRCTNEACSWPDKSLPIYIVDEEIYRFLPTVVVGTLDKAAIVGMQARMRGFIGAPWGVCPADGHGFTYAPRSTNPAGCIVPDCRRPSQPLPQASELFAPGFRLQDELHLLRDSLGAVDAHYECLLDHLQTELSGRQPKILASSATLAGYERQVDILYGRQARVFPQPGPAPGIGFWSSSGCSLMRRYVSLAPRGVTIEFAIDSLLTILQRTLRTWAANHKLTAELLDVSENVIDEIVSLYGTDVVYGNTLRDLDAVARSAETQIQVDGPIRQRTLTGRTDFSEVRETLRLLENPPHQFDERVHVVTASSMMSHGVDIDRLNVMIMVGLPLGTAEFIQATARVGRRHPGLVIVLPKIARERDASVHRTFAKFVEHCDRFVEPIPITKRSRRVLDRTVAGMELARILMIHEPRAGRSLSTVKALREYLASDEISASTEVDQLVSALRLDESVDENLRNDLDQWMNVFAANIKDSPSEVMFPNQASPSGLPMRSLRDVEEMIPVFGRSKQ